MEYVFKCQIILHISYSWHVKIRNLLVVRSLNNKRPLKCIWIKLIKVWFEYPLNLSSKKYIHIIEWHYCTLTVNSYDRGADWIMDTHVLSIRQLNTYKLLKLIFSHANNVWKGIQFPGIETLRHSEESNIGENMFLWFHIPESLFKGKPYIKRSSVWS